MLNWLVQALCEHKDSLVLVTTKFLIAPEKKNDHRELICYLCGKVLVDHEHFEKFKEDFEKVMEALGGKP